MSVSHIWFLIAISVGLLQPQEPADFIIVNNLQDLTVQRTYCHGVLVAESGKSLLPSVFYGIVSYS